MPRFCSSGSHFGISGAPWGANFGTSGTHWEAIWAPRDYPGGPWEQQDGHEVACHRILVDFGLISGPVSVSFSNFKCVSFLLSGSFLGHFFIDFSDSNFRCVGLPSRSFRMQRIAKIGFSCRSFLMKFGIDF